MNKPTVLIVDDEMRIRKLISDFLIKADFKVVTAVDGQDALDLFLQNSKEINLIILDVLMPKLDGWETLKEIRKLSVIPVIMLTAKGEESDQLNGFRLGADDYIHKPFSPSILVARVESLLKRTGFSGIENLVYGGITVNFDAHLAYLYNTVLDLTPKEYDLLLYFCDNKGIALSRDKLLNAVWNYDYYGDLRTVDTHIKQLRAKLLDCGEYIQTVRGVGYRFEVPK